MTKEEELKKLNDLRKLLIDYLFEKITDNKKIKNFFDKYLFYSTFEIDWFYKQGDFEYIQFDLAAQNTGNIYNYRYNTLTKEYEQIKSPVLFTTKVDNFDITPEILDDIFKLGREFQLLLDAEKDIKTKTTKIKSI